MTTSSDDDYNDDNHRKEVDDTQTGYDEDTLERPMKSVTEVAALV